MKLKKVSIMTMLVLYGTVVFGDCDGLIKKYNAPDPSTKTMKQVERWVKRKVKTGDAGALKECLVAKAADNPNKATVAGQ